MGYIINNGINYFGDNTVTLTQAQYDALEQAGTVDPHATYFITDRSYGIQAEYAADVVYDNTNSDLSATNVQNAIDEVVGTIENSISADQINYNNQTSGLVATNVQSAIDEVSTTLLGDLIKVKSVTVPVTSLSQGYNLTPTIDSGYKFLCWQSVGSSDGWVAGFPVYIANCYTTAGRVYWNGTMPTSQVNVIFWYFEIRNL
jgi:hypothetical protein